MLPAGVIWFQCTPLSSLRKTPFSVPAMKILGSDGACAEGANRLPLHAFDRGPALAGVVADEESAVGMIDHPGADQQGLGIGLVHQDVVHHQVVGLGQLGQPLPARATVVALVDPAVGGSQVKMLVDWRVGGKASPVPAVGTHGNPGMRTAPGLVD